MTNPINGKKIQNTELATRLMWHFVQFLVTLSFAIGVFLNLKNDTNNNTRAIAAVADRLDSIDDRGTRKSHDKDTAQQAQIEENTRRIVNLESVMRDLIPKVERIETNVLILVAREQGNKK